ncbi:MAG TPA: prolyl oligopeptidase family serine peptidase [Terriglobia bacterium]|nr:prolyl oligopeptidase family serine peptidase [Terriglobia bacterium]
MTRRIASLLALVMAVLVSAPGATAQEYSRNLAPYRVSANVTYVKNGSWEGKIDIYSRVNPPGPEPTLFWIHGGSPAVGTKDNALPSFMSYLELGWNVVNIEPRQLGVTLAPETLQNTLCAVRWSMHNAGRYNIDVNKLVISGASSGSWFAVAAGLGVRPKGWSDVCPGNEEPKFAAVVNWYGNWDLADVLQGPNRKDYAPDWVKGLPNPLDVARELNPLPLRPGVPPVISIHGDADPTVPYSQSVRLHEALQNAGVPQKLVTIPGGKHGGFPREENERAYKEVEAFLKVNGLTVR